MQACINIYISLLQENEWTSQALRILFWNSCICVHIFQYEEKDYEVIMNTAHILIKQYMYNSYKLPSIVICLYLKELM
jgi:hypothetical protein